MASYINMIDSPWDLKKLHPDQLEKLAEELREKIIRTVARNGGHLSSNLGCVELTLAIHYVFDAPHDKIVWDVGHQSYTHKIICGRRESFKTLRQEGGISGFPSPTESVFDTFGTGHSSTSISAAAGMAAARDLKGGNERIVAVIGDGALSAGMAFEALNHVGSRMRRFIVILNDNEMSISRNVGAMSAYLNRIITTPLYNKFFEEIDLIIRKIPGIGDAMVKRRQKLLESIKGLVVPGLLFEELGFRYIGPVDGNDIHDLIHILGHIKDSEKPLLLHVLTKKGKGYRPAEDHPEKFHSAAGFDIKTGRNQKPSPPTSTFSEVFSDELIKLAEKDTSIVAITAAMASGTGLDKFREKFPQRFFDVGIAEQHAITFAGGLAISGYKPVVAMYSTFLQRAYDQVLHDICLQKLPVVLALDRAGIVGADGPTHNGVFDISYLSMIPNMTIICPKDAPELRAMLRFALQFEGPIAIRYPRGNVPESPENNADEKIRYGCGKIEREGQDVAIFAVGSMVQTALAAARQLQQQGISAMVINPLKKKMQHIQLVRLGIPDRFVEHGGRDYLLDKLGLTPQSIARKIIQSHTSISVN